MGIVRERQLTLRASRVRIDDLERRRQQLRKDRSAVPVDVSVSSGVARSDSAGHAGRDDSNTNRLTLRLNPSVSDEILRRESIDRAAELNRFRAANQQEAELLTVMDGVLSVAETKAVIDVLIRREELLSQKTSYLRKRDSLGDSVRLELFDTEARMRDVRSRLVAARMRLVSQATAIDLVPDQLEWIEPLAVNRDPLVAGFQCPVSSKTLSEATLVVGQRMVELEQAEARSGISWSAYAELEDSDVASYGGKLQRELGLSVSYSFYDSGRSDVRVARARDTLRLAQDERDLAKADAAEALVTRHAVEEILLNNLGSVSSQMRSKQEQLIELNRRMELGQSVFVEATDRGLELLDLEETYVHTLTDFYSGWLGFVYDRDLLR